MITAQHVTPIPQDIHAHAVTAETLNDVAIDLNLTTLQQSGGMHHGQRVLFIPGDRRRGLIGEAGEGDWIVHYPRPDGLQDLEVFPAEKFWATFELTDRGPNDTAAEQLDRAVHAEFDQMRPNCWLVLAEHDEGIMVTFGSGIVSPAHMVGMAQMLVSRAGKVVNR